MRSWDPIHGRLFNDADPRWCEERSWAAANRSGADPLRGRGAEEGAGKGSDARKRGRKSKAGKAKPESEARKAKLGRERPERPGDLGGCPLGLIAGPWEGNI